MGEHPGLGQEDDHHRRDLAKPRFREALPGLGRPGFGFLPVILIGGDNGEEAERGKLGV